MFKFDYEFVNGFYTHLMQGNHVFIPIAGSKALVVTVILISVYRKYLKSIEKLGASEKPAQPINMGYLLRTFLLFFFVVTFDYWLGWFDLLAGSIEAQYSGFSAVPKTLIMPDELDEPTSLSWTAWIVKTGSSIVDTIQDPTLIILKIAEVVAYYLDLMVYGFFLAERFFALGVLRMFGAFALACYAYDDLKKWFWAWVSVYVAHYLLIIPYFMVNAFTNAIYDYSNLIWRGLPQQPGISNYKPSGIILTVILLFIVALKVKLFSKSFTLIKQIFI